MISQAKRTLVALALIFNFSMFCKAQSGLTPAPRLFYEDATAQQRIIQHLDVDNAGNVISYTLQTNIDCPFGICGVVVYSVASDGSVRWKTSETNFIAPRIGQSVIDSHNNIFFEDSGIEGVRAISSDGVSFSNWPVFLGTAINTSPSTLLIDPFDQSIVAKGGPASAFDIPSTLTAAYHQDGSLKWRPTLAGGAFNTPGMRFGPNNNIYTFTDHTVLLDRNTGTTLCEFPAEGGNSFVPIAGGDGFAFSYTTDGIQRAETNCGKSTIYPWGLTRDGVVLGYDQGIILAADLPFGGGPLDRRFIAVSKDGTFLWSNNLIVPLSVVATTQGLIYMIGVDPGGSTDQKLFVVSESDGSIVASVSLVSICPSCISVSVGSSGVYVGDLSSTRIYKIDGIGPLAATPSVWPMTGHDAQRTGRSSFNGPGTPPVAPVWTVTTGGPIIGDLVISAEGTIYASSDKLYALNPDGTTFAPAVPLAAITSPAIDDQNGFVYVIVQHDFSSYDVLRFSKQLQDQITVYHGRFGFGPITSMTVGPDGTVYFSDGGAVIATGARNWSSLFRPCFGNPGFLSPTLGRDGSVYTMCQPGGGGSSGSGLYRFNGATGAQIAFADYSRGGTELIIDQQNQIRAGFQAFNGAIFGGSYDTWDASLNRLISVNSGDFTTSRSALLPDGTSTVRLGFSFQTNQLEESGAHTWDILSGPATLPQFSTPPSVDASGIIFVGTISGVAAVSSIDGSTIWFASLGDNITTQPAIAANGDVIVGSAGGTIYMLKTRVTPPPQATSISPDSGIQGTSNLSISVTGQNFDPLATLSFDDGSIAVNGYTFRTSSQITAAVSIAPNAAPGSHSITVTNTDLQQSVLVNAFTVLPRVPPPVVTSVAPSFGVQGEPLPVFTVSGQNFTSTSILSFGGSGIHVVSYLDRNATAIVAAIFVDLNAQLGPRDVTVTNPDSQSATLIASFDVLAHHRFLAFPLRNKTAFTAKINTVFDHSATSQYCPDNVVVAYTGEAGRIEFGSSTFFATFKDCNGDNKEDELHGFRQSGGTSFSVGTQYTGAGDPTYLFYDGHPGFDYRTTDQQLDGALCPTSTPCSEGKTEILAVADGTVICAEKSEKGCPEGPGEIKVRHDNGYFTIYLHLSKINVKAGDLVVKGDVIGVSGDTGAKKNPHLHFEVRQNQNGVLVPVDPYGWRGLLPDPYTRAANIQLWE